MSTKPHSYALDPNSTSPESSVSPSPTAKRLEHEIAQRDRRPSEPQVHVITDALPVLVAFVNREQRYEFVNAAYERWFGHPKAAVVGRHLREVLGEEAYSAILPHVEGALSGGEIRYEAEVPYRNGGTRAIEATYIPHRADDGRVSGFVSLVADIAERKKLERFRNATATRSERLLKITAAVASAVTSEQVFEAVVDEVATAVQASSAGLWLVDDERRTTRLARSTGYAEAARQKFDCLPLDMQPSIPALDSIRRGEPIWIRSKEELLAQYPHLASSVTNERQYRIACLPLITRGRTLGALALTIEESGEASGDERDFLLLIASYASQAVERVRLFEAERRSRAEADAAAARLHVLGHASRAFVEANLDFESRIHKIVDSLGVLIDSAIAITLLDSDGRLRVAATYHPVAEAQLALQELSASSVLRMGEGISGSVASTGESVLIASVDPAFLATIAPPWQNFVERYPAYSLICVPLRSGERVIGTLAAFRTKVAQSYTADDLRLLEDVAERASTAIENSRLYQENLNARSRAEKLYRFAEAVVTADRVEQVFHAALETIRGALSVNRAAILVFDAEGVMRFRAWRGLSDEYRRAVEGHSPWEANDAAPDAIVVPNVETEPGMAGYLPLFRKEGIGALAFIPMVTGGRLLGKFMIYYATPRDYSRQEIEMASAIANHLASVTARFAAVARLEETIRHNELFTGVLAHDLRNPLGAIMTAAQLVLMRQEGEGDRNAKPLSRILTSGQRMTRMIEQLLDLSQTRAGGGIEVRPDVTNLADLCAQAVAELELAWPEWRFERSVHGDPEGTWDPDRLLQVISNLVANAGQHGDPDFGVRIQLDGRDPEFVTLEIENHGAIAETLLPTLFDPFRRRHSRAPSEGLGLGLFIVKEIVTAHGGSVDVESSEARGTSFFIRLPRHSASRGSTIPSNP